MKKEIRTIVHDDELRLDAYRLEGIVQPFPNHFHQYYVIGFMEGGERYLTCKNKEYTLKKGNLVIFNPGDNHACAQTDNGVLDYCGINISKETILNLVEEITSKRILPEFSETVINNEEAACYFRPLHEMIMNGNCEFGKEENLLLLFSLLIHNYSQPFLCSTLECRKEIEKVCTYIEQHYTQHIYLDQLCHEAGLSKSTLLRAFTKSKGVTPYLYLQNVRIGEAKKLLEQGVAPMDAGLQTAFSDQSHFTNYFTSFIGLPPGCYRDSFINK